MWKRLTTFGLPWLLTLLLPTPLAMASEVPNFGAKARAEILGLAPVAKTQGFGMQILEGRPVLVSFFASWCPPCVDEFLALETVRREFEGTNLAIVAINVFEQWDENDVPRMQTFLRRTKPGFTLVTGNAEVRELFGGIDRIPTVYGFSADGELHYKFIHKRGAPKDKMSASLGDLRAAAKLLLEQSR